MSYTWEPEHEDAAFDTPLSGWVRIILGCVFLMMVLLIGLVLTAIFRLVEKLFFGLHRPITPYFTQAVARVLLWVLGIKHLREGEVMKTPGAIVSNHSSWLDIFALFAHMHGYFLAKSEVANWPGIGFLARLIGTLFIARDRTQVKAQTRLLETRLLAGQKLIFFPEGTSTDGMRVLPFNSTLYQAFFNPDIYHEIYIQPVSIIYTAPMGLDKRFYGWWGKMDFAPHFLKILALRKKGSVRVVFHPAVKVDQFAHRKELAAYVEQVVRQGMPPERQIS